MTNKKSPTAAIIRKLLKERGISQKELAELADVTEAAVSRYLNDSRIFRAETGKRLAKALGVSLDFLLGTSEQIGTRQELEEHILRVKELLTLDDKVALVKVLFE